MSTRPKRGAHQAPPPISDPDADRIRTATLLMASMLADRMPGSDLSFKRVHYTAIAGALVLSGGVLPDSPVDVMLASVGPFA